MTREREGWHGHVMVKVQKVTVRVPADLLHRAQRACGDGVTATIRRGLELLALRDTYDAVRKLRGKVDLQLGAPLLRENRRRAGSR